MNPAVPLVGRILLTPLFFVAGYQKLMNVAGTAGYFGKVGLPMPDLLVWIVIAIELVGALLILIGWKTRVVAWIMAIFAVATAVVGHKFWIDPSQATHFLKNLAIAGGFIMLAYAGPGRLSVDKA
jgi:putative oxidoreductase